MTEVTPKRRYRFSEFTVSTARRTLVRAGREVPLIPRYFDLLVLLLSRRHEAVHRREILDAVWSDVVVSDGALSQAVRTLRRALGDDPREPVFIRTVSRHGYRFVHAGVIEEADDAALAAAVPDAGAPKAPAPISTREERGPVPEPPATASERGDEGAQEQASVPPRAASGADPFEIALTRLVAPGPLTRDGEIEDDRREAAETLHTLGTEEALRRLGDRPRHEAARAILRDARWEVPGAGAVPLLGRPGAWRSLWILIGLRLRRAARLAGTRWSAASAGGAAAGLIAGLAGGIVIHLASGGGLRARVPVVFALVGLVIGGLGAAGVGAGLAAAEAVARSFRGAALVALGALGGGGIGLLAHSVGRWTLEGLFGHDLSPVGGAFEGLALGSAAGLGYAITTPRPGGGGMATPRGTARLFAALVTGACCALAGLAATFMGGNLGGGSLDFIARSFQGSEVGLRPLALLFGEQDPGPVTRSVLSAYEGLLFGFGLILGLTRRPRAKG